MKLSRLPVMAVLLAACSLSHAAYFDLETFSNATAGQSNVTFGGNEAILTEVTLGSPPMASFAIIYTNDALNLASFEYRVTGTNFYATVSQGGNSTELTASSDFKLFQFADAPYSGSLSFQIGGTGRGPSVGEGDVGILTIRNVLIADVTSPVPEPETYAMLLAGMGLMGAVARPRKNKHIPVPLPA